MTLSIQKKNLTFYNCFWTYAPYLKQKSYENMYLKYTELNSGSRKMISSVKVQIWLYFWCWFNRLNKNFFLFKHKEKDKTYGLFSFPLVGFFISQDMPKKSSSHWHMPSEQTPWCWHFTPAHASTEKRGYINI